MRTGILASLVIISLVTGGCKSNSNGKNGLLRPSNSGGSKDIFLGSPVNSTKDGDESKAGNTYAPDAANLTSGGNTRQEGVLAGRILDLDNRLQPGAVIQVIDLESKNSVSATLSVIANRDGYFDVGGLESGKSYRLVARSRDGNRTIMGSARVIAPNIRVAIYLSEENSEDLDSKSLPIKNQTHEVPSATTPPQSEGPTASLGSPVTNNPTPSGITIPLPPTGESSLSVGNRNSPDASLIADGKQSAGEGLTREIPSPNVTIPSLPGRESQGRRPSSPTILPEISDSGAQGNNSPESKEHSSQGLVKTEIPDTKTSVPSCVRVGNRIHNFAVYDEKGGIFEFSKEPKPKVTLLDFWFTACPPCRSAIPHLNNLQNKYGRFGLQVVGIAYEQGSIEEKKQAILNGRQKYRLSFQYPILLGGGGVGPCPLAEQLEVQRFPTLVLLDETGKIIYRCQGLDAQNSYEVEMAIRKQLFPRQLASP